MAGDHALLTPRTLLQGWALYCGAMDRHWRTPGRYVIMSGRRFVMCKPNALVANPPNSARRPLCRSRPKSTTTCAYMVPPKRA